jgi:glutamate racemase
VPLLEEGQFRGPVVDEVVKMYLRGLKGRIDTLILGCTHYPLLKPAISAYLKGVHLVDSAQEVARMTENVLREEGLLRQAHRAPAAKKFYVTDEPATFTKIARIFLKRTIARPRVVNL